LGDIKIRAIENLDKRFLGRLINSIDGDYRILVMPDHPTPIVIKTHTSDPVPFLLNGIGVKADKANEFSEAEAGKSSLFIKRL
jgi:2,3-bisphosphoglycerate-independent phosphoglycerate mutase